MEDRINYQLNQVEQHHSRPLSEYLLECPCQIPQRPHLVIKQDSPYYNQYIVSCRNCKTWLEEPQIRYYINKGPNSNGVMQIGAPKPAAINPINDNSVLTKLDALINNVLDLRREVANIQHGLDAIINGQKRKRVSEEELKKTSVTIEDDLELDSLPPPNSVNNNISSSGFRKNGEMDNVHKLQPTPKKPKK